MASLMLQPVNLIGLTGTYSTLTTAYTGNTITIDVEGINTIDLNIALNATASNTELQWQIEFSSDGTTFFGEDVYSASGATITHQANQATHSWTPGGTSTYYKNVQLTNLACKKLKFSCRNQTAGGSVWVEAVLHQVYIT